MSDFIIAAQQVWVQFLSDAPLLALFYLILAQFCVFLFFAGKGVSRGWCFVFSVLNPVSWICCLIYILYPVYILLITVFLACVFYLFSFISKL